VALTTIIIVEVTDCVTPIEEIVEVTDSVTPIVGTYESIQYNKDSNIITPETKNEVFASLSESLVSVKSYESPVRIKNRLVKDINYYGEVFQPDGKLLDYVVGKYSYVKDITKLTEMTLICYQMKQI